MRLFVALFPPQDVREELWQRLREATARSSSPVRLTPVERWHLTLAFLGEVPDDDLSAVELAISRIVAEGAGPGDRPVPGDGLGTGPGREIRLRLAGGGSFGKALWAGVDGDLTALDRLHGKLRRSLAEAGLLHDERPLAPHLTVSYRGGTPALRQALHGHSGRPWTAGELTLVRSRHHEGGGYDVLRTWSLG